MPIAPALLPRCRRDMTLAEGVGCTTIDGPRSTVAVDDTMRLQTRGSGTEWGGMVGEIEGYLWMPRRSANVRGEEEATAAVQRLQTEDPAAAALLRLHADRLRNAERQARLARRFTAAHPGVPVTEVYALAEDVHDLEGLREVGTLLASTKPTP